MLIDAVAKTKATGTSTFVMSMIEEEDNYMKTLNLGDSGFMLLRLTEDGSALESVFRSKE